MKVSLHIQEESLFSFSQAAVILIELTDINYEHYHWLIH